MTGNRTSRVLVRSARLTTGALAAAACVIGVAAGVAAPWPEIVQSPAQVSLTPQPGETVLACSGPFRALGRDAQSAVQMSVAGDMSVTWGTASSAPVVGELDAAGLDAAGSDGGITVPVFTAPPEGDEAALIAAAESLELRDADLAGFAAAACRPPAMDSWLVGGVTATGANDLLLIANPGEVAASATLTVYGTEPVSSTLVVPPQTQIAVPLAANAAGQPTPIVRVSATGAPVRAMLQSSLIRTLEPGGIDIQDSAGQPLRDLVLPGVQVSALGADITAALIRVMATETDAVARVTVRDIAGAIVREETLPLSAQSPAEMSLTGLDAGVYSVELHADGPLVAGVWQTTGFGAGSDFAWMTPAPALEGTALVAIPAGPAAQLHLVNTGSAAVEATLRPRTGGSGGAQPVTVPAGGSVLVPVESDRVYEMTASGPVHAAVAMGGPVTGGEGLAGWPVWPGTSALQAVTVYP